MIGTLIFNMIALLFAWLESSGRYKNGLKISFFTIFLFLSLRYNFGNDYMGYLNSFLETNSYNTFNLSSISYKGYEIGWVLLTRLFGPIGFFAMTAILAALTCIVFYRFIRKYVPPQYYWISIFLYVFSPSFFFNNTDCFLNNYCGGRICFFFCIKYLSAVFLMWV